MNSSAAIPVENAVDILVRKLSSPDSVVSIATDESYTDSLPGASGFDPVSLSRGFPGVAHFFAELGRLDKSYLKVADKYIKLSLDGLAAHGSNGVNYGPWSVLSAVQIAESYGSGYSRLRSSLVSWAAADLSRQLAHMQDRISRGENLPWGFLDVVNGLSGQISVLLCEAEREGVTSVLRDAQQSIVETLGDVTTFGERVPGFWTPGESEPYGPDRIKYPRGSFNVGLSHGIPGILATLSACASAGIATPASLERIPALINVIRQLASIDDAGPYWPARVSFEQWLTGERDSRADGRHAWCYGTPGVAGTILRTPSAESMAVKSAISSLIAQSGLTREEAGVDGPTVCHGLAGLIVAVDCTRCALVPELSAWRGKLLQDLVNYVSEDLPLGVQHYAPKTTTIAREVRTFDQLNLVGVLEGAAGVGCCLVDAIAGAGDTSWRRTICMGYEA